MTRAIPDAAVSLIEAQEGVELEAYRDIAGVWTIGYGHTDGVSEGDVITKDQALAFLREDLAVAAQRLEARIGPVIDKLNDNQYSALLSFVFNEGAGPGWTIWALMNAGVTDADTIRRQLLRFVYVHKNGQAVISSDLARRRRAEADLYATPVASPST